MDFYQFTQLLSDTRSGEMRASLRKAFPFQLNLQLHQVEAIARSGNFERALKCACIAHAPGTSFNSTPSRIKNCTRIR
jgi:hypothetical protein